MSDYLDALNPVSDPAEIPEKFRDFLGPYEVVLYDSGCKEPVAWGHFLTGQLGEDLWNELKHYGSLEFVDPKTKRWALVLRHLSREEAAITYGAVTAETYGPRGGWKSVRFGSHEFLSKCLKKEKA